MESRHLLNLSVQNALDCISEKFNLKNFSGGACARNSLEKCVLRCPYVCYISRTPLSQNARSAPGSTVLQYEQSIKIEKCKSYQAGTVRVTASRLPAAPTWMTVEGYIIISVYINILVLAL